MSNFIEELYYGNIDPQARSTEQNQTVQKAMNITYRQVGDYLIPNIKLAEEDKQPIGKYGMMRKDYLYNNKRVHFNIMLMNGALTRHLLSVQQEAEETLVLLITQMAKAQGITEELKSNDQIKWVGLMNNIQHSAE